jgi:hypothetical protein
VVSIIKICYLPWKILRRYLVLQHIYVLLVCRAIWALHSDSDGQAISHHGTSAKRTPSFIILFARSPLSNLSHRIPGYLWLLNSSFRPFSCLTHVPGCLLRNPSSTSANTFSNDLLDWKLKSFEQNNVVPNQCSAAKKTRQDRGAAPI